MEKINLFPVYCNYNRDLAQVANAFIDQFKPDLDVLDDHIYNEVWNCSEYESFLREMADYIHTKEPRLGEPGYVPDLAYYIEEYVNEVPEDRGWWNYSVGSDYDPICEFLYQPVFAWHNGISAVVREVDTEDYVYDNYGLDVGDADWPYNDLDYCIDGAMDNDNNHGFTRNDLKYVLEELMDRDKLQEEVYDGGSLGYHCIDGEDYCETGSCFLGNGEECLDLDWWGIRQLYDYSKLPVRYRKCYDDSFVKDNISILNDDCYVDDNLKYAYITLSYIIYFYYDWDDVIETALENGFEMDENKNIIRKEGN